MDKEVVCRILRLDIYADPAWKFFVTLNIFHIEGMQMLEKTPSMPIKLLTTYLRKVLCSNLDEATIHNAEVSNVSEAAD